MIRRCTSLGLLVIFVNILETSCIDYKRSLAFAIANRRSMEQEIGQIVSELDSIVDIVVRETDSTFEDIIVVDFFDDKDATISYKGVDAEKLKASMILPNETEHGHSSNSTRSLAGSKRALHESHRDSMIYVFTDAAASDNGLIDETIRLCGARNSQIFFVLTGQEIDSEGIRLYHKIAEDCHGQVFQVKKGEVTQVLKLLKKHLKINTILPQLSSRLKAIGVTEVSFKIHPQTENALVSVAGLNIGVEIIDPDTVKNESFSTENFKVIELPNPRAGGYVIEVTGKSDFSLIVYEQKSSTISDQNRLEPIVTINEGNEKTVNYDDSLSLTCRVTSIPEPDIILWKNKNGEVVTSTKKTIEVDVNELTITLKNNRRSDVFSCVAGSTVKEVSEDFNLTVLSPFVVKAQLEETVEVYRTDEHVLNCNIASRFPMDITWFYKGSDILKNKASNKSDVYTISKDKTTLTIQSMNKDAEGNYTCEACLLSNEAECKAHHFSLKMLELVPPEISKPADTIITTTVEHTVILACTVIKGNPKPEITWEHSSSTPNRYVHNESNGDLTIASAEPEDEGSYKCVAKNRAGNDSLSLALVVQVPPKLQSNGGKIRIIRGTDIVMPCTVLQGKPPPTVTWHFQAVNSNTPRAINATEGELRITNATFSNTGNYTCVARNNVHFDSVVTELIVEGAPSILKGNTSITVTAKAPVTIPCKVRECYPKPTVTWWFQAKNTPEPEAVYGTDEVLTIASVELKNAGSYICVATNSIASVKQTTELIVEAAPMIEVNEEIIFKAVEGDLTLSIPCQVTGYPEPNVTWWVNSLVISSGEKYTIENHTLTINRPIVKDSGNYICKAENRLGKTEKTFTSNVTHHPGFYINTQVGEPITIDCRTHINDTVNWYKDGTHFNVRGYALKNYKVRVEDTGAYACEVINKLGSYFVTFNVNVGYRPSFITKQDDINIKYHGNEILDCDVRAKPEAQVIWQRDGETLLTAKDTFQLNSPEPGSYICLISNIYGQVQREFNLIFRVAPKIAPSEETITVAKGSTIVIPCEILEGVPAPNITWKFQAVKSSATPKEIETWNGGLYIRNSSTLHDGNYTCIAENIEGLDAKMIQFKSGGLASAAVSSCLLLTLLFISM